MTGEGLPANGRRRMDGKLLAVEGEEASRPSRSSSLLKDWAAPPSEIAKAKAKSQKSGEASGRSCHPQYSI